jgi:hypothetical protein
MFDCEGKGCYFGSKIICTLKGCKKDKSCLGHATFGQEERRVLCGQKMQLAKIEVTYFQLSHISMVE